MRFERVWGRSSGRKSCRMCGTTESRHKTDGFCDRCYSRNRQREKVGTPLDTPLYGAYALRRHKAMFGGKA